MKTTTLILSTTFTLTACSSAPITPPSANVTVDQMVAATQKALKDAKSCLTTNKATMPLQISSATLSLQTTREHVDGAGFDYLVISAGASRDVTKAIGIELDLQVDNSPSLSALEGAIDIDAEVKDLSQAICDAGHSVKLIYPDNTYKLKTNQLSVKLDFSVKYDANAKITVTPVQLFGSIDRSKQFENSITVAFGTTAGSN